MIEKTRFRETFPDLPLESVIFQHAAEVAFGWDLRAHAVSSPIYELTDLRDLDNRIEANIDGLRIAGDAGWRAVRDQLDVVGPGEAFSAGAMAVDGSSVDRFTEVIEALEAAATDPDSPHPVRGLVSAVGWFPFVKVRHQLEVCLKTNSDVAAAVGIGGAAIHRQDPGEALGRALGSDIKMVRRRAIKAVGELRRVDLARELLPNQDDEASAFYRAWALALLQAADMRDELRRIAAGAGDFAERAVELSVRLGDPHDARSFLTELSGNPETIRIAAKGAGALGDVAVVAWLLEQMHVPEYARVVGQAFSTITGLDLADADLETDEPQDVEAGPNDDPDDPFVGMDPDEELPWPDPARVEQWWADNRNRFTIGQRYFLGKPAGEQTWREALNHASQWHRRAAALELALADSKSVLFEVRAPGFRQIAALRTPNSTNHE